MSASSLHECVRRIIPPLTASHYKGMAGKVGVFGGSKEYTGAPFFAAMASLRAGADLAHVFCAAEASTAIKAYSPELIVHPLDYPHSRDAPKDAAPTHSCIKDTIERVVSVLERLSVLVVGPGLGRDPYVLMCAKEVIRAARTRKLPLVIDADGLYVVTEEPQLVQGYPLATLTPNANEFRRLYEAVMGTAPRSIGSAKGGTQSSSSSAEGAASDSLVLSAEALELSEALGAVTIVRKGACDVIAASRAGKGGKTAVATREGSFRRCGGQGDILSGSIATFTAWAHAAEKEKGGGAGSADGEDAGPPPDENVVAAFGACELVRESSRRAFVKRGRSMVAGDLLEEIHPSFEALYDSAQQ